MTTSTKGLDTPPNRYSRVRALFEAIAKRDPNVGENDWDCMSDEERLRMAEAIDEVFPVVVSETKPRWIPIEEQLPPHPFKVAVMSLRGTQREYGVGEFWPSNGLSAGVWVSDLGHKATHWTPLPETPK